MEAGEVLNFKTVRGSVVREVPKAVNLGVRVAATVVSVLIEMTDI